MSLSIPFWMVRIFLWLKYIYNRLKNNKQLIEFEKQKCVLKLQKQYSGKLKKYQRFMRNKLIPYYKKITDNRIVRINEEITIRQTFNDAVLFNETNSMVSFNLKNNDCLELSEEFENFQEDLFEIIKQLKNIVNDEGKKILMYPEEILLDSECCKEKRTLRENNNYFINIEKSFAELNDPNTIYKVYYNDETPERKKERIEIYKDYFQKKKG